MHVWNTVLSCSHQIPSNSFFFFFRERRMFHFPSVSQVSPEEDCARFMIQWITRSNFLFSHEAIFTFTLLRLVSFSLLISFPFSLISYPSHFLIFYFLFFSHFSYLFHSQCIQRYFIISLVFLVLFLVSIVWVCVSCIYNVHVCFLYL